MGKSVYSLYSDMITTPVLKNRKNCESTEKALNHYCLPCGNESLLINKECITILNKTVQMLLMYIKNSSECGKLYKQTSGSSVEL